MYPTIHCFSFGMFVSSERYLQYVLLLSLCRVLITRGADMISWNLAPVADPGFDLGDGGGVDFVNGGGG